MSLPLEDILITIDTHEEANKEQKTRIKAITEWATANGVCDIDYQELPLCDYRIMGTFHDHEINIGIEYKTMSNFCSDEYQDIKEKLVNSFTLYDKVALFIEAGNYMFTVGGFGETNISCTVKKDLTITGKLAIFEGACSTLERAGVYVRQLRSEAHFPYAIENLLTYVTHDHSIVPHAKIPYTWQYRHTLKTFLTSKQVDKVVSCYPNLFWLCSSGEESYKEILGSKTGKKLYDFIRNPELVTDEWKKGKFQDGTDKIIIPEDDNDKELQSQCDPAGSLLEKRHNTTPPADDNDKKKVCTHPTHRDLDDCQEEQCIGCGECKYYKIQNSDDKTDRSGLTSFSRPPQQGPEPILQAPVLSELKPFPVTANKELDVMGEPILEMTEGKEISLSTHRMSVRSQLEKYLEQPHTLQECVDKLDNFQKGTVWEHVMRMKKEGVIVEFDNKTLVMTR